MNGEHTKPVEVRSEDDEVLAGVRQRHEADERLEIRNSQQAHQDRALLLAEIERLRETLNCPRLTSTASTEQITAVLHDWDKGRPVNTQDLINALAWRIDNQRREIARLQERLKVTS